mmetsp:Transcript_36635/g.72037  ORF Transcript_36635/g.72037 Transcript_36635/m.72037 type:complete len:126 (+) Transcript_36635:201-578(+)
MEILREKKEPLRMRTLNRLKRMKLALMPDSAYSRKTYSGRLGWLILLVEEDWTPEKALELVNPWENCISWHTEKHNHKHGSSTVAEATAFESVVKHLPRIKSLSTQMWGTEPLVTFFTDCNPLFE